jgi:hypothetical protein
MTMISKSLLLMRTKWKSRSNVIRPVVNHHSWHILPFDGWRILIIAYYVELGLAPGYHFSHLETHCILSGFHAYDKSSH